MADVVCVGILVADVWAKPVNEWPERGRLSLVDAMGLSIGGCAANTGIDLAKLGVDVAVMGKVGDDGFGDFVVRTLESYGVTSKVARTSAAGTSATMIMIDDEGERTFIHYIGANAELRAEDLDLDLICSSRIFHIAGALVLPGIDGEPAAEIMKKAREAGVLVSLDTVWDATGRWMEVLEPQLRQADLFMPSLAEAQQLVGRENPDEVADALLEYGPKVVALKMGEKGSLVKTADGQRLELPAYPVEVVDGTGSGDAYDAGFLCGWLRGWSLEKIARFANAVGALCCTGIGTVAGVKSFEETVEFLRRVDPEWENLP